MTDPRMRISTGAGGVLFEGSMEEFKAATARLRTDAGEARLAAGANGQLKAIIERVERLEEDKAGVAADIKEVYAEAKGAGFDTKIIRKVVRLRKTDRAKRQEEEALVDLYLSAVGEL